MNRFVFELKFTVPVISKDRWQARKILQKLIQSKADFDLESIDVLEEERIKFVRSQDARDLNSEIARINNEYLSVNDLK
jgi:hypothetical protein